jgi:hypothetical protein
MNNELKINIEKEEGRVFIYEGKAPVIQDPKVITITGNIDAPARWLKNKEIIPENAHLRVDRENMAITLDLEDKNAFGDTITGRTEFHPVFKKFEINTGNYRTPQELAQLFKMNRSFFENQSTAMKLVTELQNFKAKVANEVEKSDNNRGNRTEIQKQVVNSNLPENFNICIPIFKGQPKKTFEVEIYINPADLTCSLVSPQANDLTEQFRDEIIDTQIAAIIAMFPTITIIEQ